jgi:hypothetical protein
VSLLRAIVLAFVALAAAGGVARADEVADRGATVAALETRHRGLTTERRAAAAEYAGKTAAVAALKAQRSSWARDRKLGALLAESKDLAEKLERRDAELRALDARLTAERRALLAAIDRTLAADPARTAELAPRRAALAQALGATEKPLRIADERIAPTDDAADLDYKAAALAQSERSLRLEEQRLTARATYFRKQAKLARSHARADEVDIFRDEEPRRGGGPRGGDADEASTPGDGPVITGESAPPPFTGPPGRGDVPSTLDLAADPSVVLADVVAAGTLDELRRAERLGDPESMARAAERARAEVEARAERLRLRRIEMEQRARQLRGEIPK